MARYVVHVRSPIAPGEAFAYMADLTNFARWDPGVDAVDQVVGDGPGPDAAYDVKVNGVGPAAVTLRYRTVEYDAPTSMVALAENRVMTSRDTITVRPDGAGSIVTYDAELTLKGPLGLGDPLLGLTFDQIGDRAATGLVEALDGERADDPSS